MDPKNFMKNIVAPDNLINILNNEDEMSCLFCIPLDCEETQPVHPRGNQSWIFIGRTEAEAEAPIIWPRDAKS